MNFKSFSTENGAQFAVETVTSDMLGKTESYNGSLKINNQDYFAQWDASGKCIFTGYLDPKKAEQSPETFSLVSVNDPGKDSIPSDLKTRVGANYRILKEVRDLSGLILRYVGEINVGGIWKETSWNYSGKSMHGTNNRTDYDLITTKPIA